MVHTWLGRYTFNVLEMPFEPNWLPAIGGLYLFVGYPIRSQFSSGYSVLYVGQTKTIHTRLPNHENLQEARDLGMTHLHYMREENEIRRKEIEKQLVKRYQPILNKQYR